MAGEMIPYSDPRVSFGVLRGPAREAYPLALKLEKRGDIRVLGRGVAYSDRGRAMRAVPYVPLRTAREVRNRAVLKVAGWTFRCCTALIISKLSGEVTQGVTQ